MSCRQPKREEGFIKCLLDQGGKITPIFICSIMFREKHTAVFYC